MGLVKPVYAVFIVKHSGHFPLHLERVEAGGSGGRRGESKTEMQRKLLARGL